MEQEPLKRFAVFGHTPSYEPDGSIVGGINDLLDSFDYLLDAIIYAEEQAYLFVHVFDFDKRKVVWDRSWK